MSKRFGLEFHDPTEPNQICNTKPKLRYYSVRSTMGEIQALDLSRESIEQHLLVTNQKWTPTKYLFSVSGFCFVIQSMCMHTLLEPFLSHNHCKMSVFPYCVIFQPCI